MKIVIIGGVAAGATAAARLRRLDETAEITLLEKGPYVSFANCGLPYFISRDIQRRSHLLLQTPEGFFGRYRVNVRTKTEAVAVDRGRKEVVVRTARGEESIPYDRLILAQGGSPVIPSIPGAEREHVFTLWTIPQMDRIDKFIEEKKPRSAVIAGGGFIGLEMAEALHARGIRVTVIEMAPHVMLSMDREFGAMIKAGLHEAGIAVKTGAAISEIGPHAVRLNDGSSVHAEMVLLSVGVRASVALASAAGLEVGAGGGLVVDEMLRTGDPDIFAAGDMVEVVHRVHGRRMRIPLAGPANRQGRIAATNALGGRMKYRGALGTSVVKILSRTAASTGLTERAAREAGFRVGVAYVFKDHHAAYYPGSRPLAFKLVYDMDTARPLGAQAYGEAGVEKRIDVIATAVQGKLTLEDLSELDLAYAPPYNTANDPVNIAAFIGLNHISGYSPLKTPAEVLDGIAGKSGVVLDVRTTGEQARAPLTGALHIPADEIRDRLQEVPRSGPIHILSRDGFLGHTTLRVLKAAGHTGLFNIAGGQLAAKWFDGWDFSTQQEQDGSE